MSWTPDPFLPGMGALLSGCAALGILFGRVLKGSGSAPCPACGEPVHDVERSGRSAGILCAGCGRFLCSEGGELRPMDEDAVADEPVFGAALTASFQWPPGCVVCGAPVTQALPVRIMEAEATSVGMSVVGLAMAATFGVGFLVYNGRRISIDVPHCAEHDDGVVLAEGGPTGFLLLFRSHPYQREFCALNAARAVESPELGRSAASESAPAARPRDPEA
jgi:hypothetical protein